MNEDISDPFPDNKHDSFSRRDPYMAGNQGDSLHLRPTSIDPEKTRQQIKVLGISNTMTIFFEARLR